MLECIPERLAPSLVCCIDALRGPQYVVPCFVRGPTTTLPSLPHSRLAQVAARGRLRPHPQLQAPLEPGRQVCCAFVFVVAGVVAGVCMCCGVEWRGLLSFVESLWAVMDSPTLWLCAVFCLLGACVRLRLLPMCGLISMVCGLA